MSSPIAITCCSPPQSGPDIASHGVAAIHDTKADADNPHCHLVLRDRHIETGKRAVNMSEKGSTERTRELWETVANEALEAAGSDARIDRRSLIDQGITDRRPQGHER